MKMKMFTMLVLNLGLAIGAEASSLRPLVWEAELTHVNVDDKFSQHDQIASALVTIDYGTRHATLTLLRRFECPMGAMCADMPVPVQVYLPITGYERDDCGSRIIHAGEDLRPVDGDSQYLAIRDNTQNHCPSFVARPSTEVLYQTEYSGRGRSVSTRSTFSGGALRPVHTN